MGQATSSATLMTDLCNVARAACQLVAPAATSSTRLHELALLGILGGTAKLPSAAVMASSLNTQMGMRPIQKVWKGNLPPSSRLRLRTSLPGTQTSVGELP